MPKRKYHIYKVTWIDAVADHDEGLTEGTPVVSFGIMRGKNAKAVRLSMGHWPKTGEWGPSITIPLGPDVVIEKVYTSE